MKALVYTAPEAMAVEDRNAPDADGEVLVDVAFCGICGSDMHAFLGHDERRPAPLVLGHEAAGTTRDGRRVVVNPLVTSPESEASRAGHDNLDPGRQILSMPPRDGAFAQVIRVPERNIFTVPDHVPLEMAALTEPLACGWHGANLAIKHGAAPLEAHEGSRRAVIIGGGAIGLASALALVAKGAPGALIVEPNRSRWDDIAAAGPFEPIAPDALTSLTPRLIVDAYGSGATRAAASEAVAPGGTIVHVGLGNNEPGFNSRRATLQEVAFVGAYTYTMAEFGETLDAIATGALGPLAWTATRPLDDGAAAFADIRAGRSEKPKIILAMP